MAAPQVADEVLEANAVGLLEGEGTVLEKLDRGGTARLPIE